MRMSAHPGLRRKMDKEENMKRSHLRHAVFAAAAALSLTTMAARAADVDAKRLLEADKHPADWLTYHGSYKSWHYSGLDQINTNNIKNLKVAWTHATPHSTRGLQSFPLVADGILYYTGSHNQIFALDGATGNLIWAYKQKLNEDLVAKQTHSPYNRGIAIGFGNIYMGTLDGKLVAVDMKTGKQAWETKLVESEKLTVGFTGAPHHASGMVIIGSQGGEWPYRGPIFGVDAKSGKLAWTFFTVGGNDADDPAMKTWGGDSWKTGGGGGWMAGGYDPKTNTVYWGTANPAPLYDWGGADWKTKGARPGDNLYTTSVLAMDPDTGKLKSFHQELPHDAWDFDSAVGEFVMLERDGKEYIVHPINGEVKWQVDYAEPPLASLLSTKGNLVFVPDARGYLHALDARTGKELWSHNDGQGHNGGIISYMAKGKQYVAVATGWGGLAGDDYKVLYGEPFVSMPTDQGALVVFGL